MHRSSVLSKSKRYKIKKKRRSKENNEDQTKNNDKLRRKSLPLDLDTLSRSFEKQKQHSLQKSTSTYFKKKRTNTELPHMYTSSDDCIQTPIDQFRKNTPSNDESNNTPRTVRIRKLVQEKEISLGESLRIGKFVPEPIVYNTLSKKKDCGIEEKKDDRIRDIYGFVVKKEYVKKYNTWYENYIQNLEQLCLPFSEFKDTETKNIKVRTITELMKYGIPSNRRKEIWKVLMDIDDKMQVNWKGYYQRLLEEEEDIVVDKKYSNQIDKDLIRTFDDEVVKRVPDFINNLREVLICYAKHNHSVGYNQSMNFLAACFLLFMDNESSFWCLRHVVEELLPGYFTDQMQGLIVDVSVFRTYVKGYLPEIDRHFKKTGLSTMLVVNQWFSTMFFKNVPTETTFRIWDIVFFKGVSGLFEFGIRILSYLQEKILAEEDSMGIMTMIMKKTQSIFDIEDLLCIELNPEISNGHIKLLRDHIKRKIHSKGGDLSQWIIDN